MRIFQQFILYITAFLYSIIPVPTYTEGVVGQPRSFLPSQTITQTDKTISKLIFRGLFRYDIYGVLVPDLADNWEVSEGGLVYTIKLKDNQFWSNGTKITADDLIYTAFKVADLSGVATDKVDELTVRYTLPNKFSPFLSLLTVGIMPANAVENSNALSPISSGPFRILRVEYSGPAIQNVILFHTNPQEQIRRLVFRFYSNEEELSLAARLGEIDGFLSTQLVNLENFSTYKFPIQGVYYALFFNLRLEKLQDLELRKKMRAVLPTHKLISGKGISVEGGISRSLFTDKSLEFDYFDEDFYPEDTNISLNITVPDLPVHVQMAKRIKEYWEDDLGIDVELIRVEPERFSADVIEPRDFEVLFYGQEVGRDPDRYINWHSTQKAAPGLNLSGFEQVRADRSLEEGRNEIDNDVRVVHYSEFQKSLLDNVPIIFLYHPYATYYVNQYIEGIGEKYTFSLSDRFLDFDNWHRVVTN